MKRKVYLILLIVFIMLFVLSGFFIGRQLLETKKAVSGFNEVSAMMHERISAVSDRQSGRQPSQGAAGNALEAPGEAVPGEAVPGEAVPGEAVPGEAEPDADAGADGDARLIAYRELHEEYPDFIGRIVIPGTVIDYPVMHTPNYPEFYINRDFNKEKSRHGTPFLDLKCDVLLPSDNMIIYAHHMKDGTMFASLDKYKDRSFYEAHPVIEFDTLYSVGVYEIVAVFLGSGNTDAPGAFVYNLYTDFGDEGRFAEFFEQVMGRRLYDTGIVPEYGDKFLTLSTCEYSTANNRLVVVARLT